MLQKKRHKQERKVHISGVFISLKGENHKHKTDKGCESHCIPFALAASMVALLLAVWEGGKENGVIKSG